VTLRVLFHVNHLWGAGHYARIAAIADAVVASGGAATILAGNTPLPGRLNPGVRLIELPVLRSPDATYARIVDAAGAAPSPALWSERAMLIEAALRETRPDIVVTETFPFGRRKLAEELLHLIAAATAQHAKIVSSLRDLPTAPTDPRRLDECAARLRTHYDAVLVHGDPTIFGLDEIWPGEVPVPMRPTGYVVRPLAPAAARSGVLVSAGGGGDAAPLLRAAAAAQQGGLLLGEPWTFVTGPSAPASLLEELAHAAAENRIVVRSIADLPDRIAAARLSLSRGGYNTVVETVAAGTPCVVVPHAPEGEPEQDTRARRFAALGLLVHLAEADLTPQSLARAAQTGLSQRHNDAIPLQTDGAARSAALLAEIAGGG
jgi:predicted glycosyltransferase